jgi:hypothetical protein
MFGSLPDGFINARPPAYEVGSAGQLAKATTAKYRRGIGLKLASDWLSAAPANFGTIFDGTKRISFRFGSMRLLSIPLAVLSRTLADAEPTLALADVFGARLFVISEVLQAKEFLLIAEGDSAQAIALSPLVLDPVGAGVEMSIDSSLAHAGILAFKATKHHSIGFKAYEIELSGGDFRLVPSAASAALSHMTEEEPTFEPVLFDELQFS